MKPTSTVLFVGAICLAISGQWLLHAQLSSNNPLVQNPNMVDRPRTSQRDQMLEEMTKQPITWTKPTGPAPAWLERGRKRSQSIERIRDLLAGEIEPRDIQRLPLATVLASLSSELELPIVFNEARLTQTRISGETPITLQFTGSLRTFLDVLLGPYELTYVINEAGLEVSTSADAASKPSIGVYDLSFVAADSQNARLILQTMVSTMNPLNADGKLEVFMVNQLLIAYTLESTHVEIESLLARLAPVDSEKSPVLPNAVRERIPTVGRQGRLGEDPSGN